MSAAGALRLPYLEKHRVLYIPQKCRSNLRDIPTLSLRSLTPGGGETFHFLPHERLSTFAIQHWILGIDIRSAGRLVLAGC